MGALYRQRLSGVLQLISAGHTNEIELQNGLVVRVNLGFEAQRLGDQLRRHARDPQQFDRAMRVALARSSDARPLGERLVATGAACARVIGEVVQELHQTRLERLFCVAQGQLRFRILYRATRSGIVMGPASFLHDRRRYRDRAKSRSAREGAYDAADSNRASLDRANLNPAELERAYGLLGLTPGASAARIKAAFKVRAAECHPDRVQHRGAAAVEHATGQFRQCADSYRLLMDALSHG